MFCYNFLVKREISEMRRPIGAIFCTVISTRTSFITPVQKFQELTPKNFCCQKHAKFGPILDDFKVRRQISPEGMKIFKN